LFLISDSMKDSKQLLKYVIFEVFTTVAMKNGMLYRVDLVITDVSEERRASFIKVKRIGK
jgi:hypothetical protein